MASVYIAEIHFLLPKIPLLPRLTDFGQLYFSLTKNIPALIDETKHSPFLTHQTLSKLQFRSLVCAGTFRNRSVPVLKISTVPARNNGIFIVELGNLLVFIA